MAQHQFIPGQRWISDNEPGLGLGIVLESSGRMVDILFPASSEKRTYAGDNAPLTRVIFAPGDTIEDQQGTNLTVNSRSDRGGLVHYLTTDESGEGVALAEQQLSFFLQFNRPQQRLFSGQINDPHWFELRYDTLNHLQRLERSPIRGLGGVRTALLPHQLYIAREISRREAPRILLADEVGLGKTIEACLILHHRFLTGRASRALLLVPAALINQWLVELLRRFNLRFSLYDEARCQAIQQSDQHENPFLAEQKVLASAELFLNQPERLEQALEAGWDLLIVDEAHHLEWHRDYASPSYLLVENLAASIPGVLLLTATPEQLGRDGHFARLRLLDPDRFHSFNAFRSESDNYRPLADVVNYLLREQALPEEGFRSLKRIKDPTGALKRIITELSHPDSDTGAAREKLIAQLLDRHGTGRVMFRNTRAQVKGFPQRQLHAFPLPLPDEYRLCLESMELPVDARLMPESLERGLASPAWPTFDPRVSWLVWRLKSLPGEKVLLICANSDTALELATALRTREGIHAGVFHQNTSIIERDRAAAWFAQVEDGCQLLICSEIGSEGRNFQFAHHLVLFDLPMDPDLLEQRIGRLDRIGQTEKIEIHVPYFEESAQSVLLRWYHRGLGIFDAPCPGGHRLFSQLNPALQEMIEEPATNDEALEALIEETHRLNLELTEALSQGRDRLLELNSCREPDASALKKQIETEMADNPLAEYMEQVFSAYGVESEVHSAASLILKKGQHMLRDNFPGLSEEGMTCTFDRETALTHEDRQFLTWEHPLVTGVMEMITEGREGSSCVSAARHPRLAAGQILLEMLLRIESPAPKYLEIGRFLPVTQLRLLIDQQQCDCSEIISRESLRSTRIPIEQSVAKQLALSLRSPCEVLLKRGMELAEAGIPSHIKTAQQAVHSHYQGETARLEALRKINPNVRVDEIVALKSRAAELTHHLRSARLRLDALHLIVGL